MASTQEEKEAPTNSHYTRQDRLHTMPQWKEESPKAICSLQRKQTVSQVEEKHIQ